MNEQDLFNAVVKLNPDQRAGFLDLACAQQPALRQQVESLLRAHDSSGFLADPQPPAVRSTLITSDATGPSRVIADRYKLLEQIGEGGMGTVWVAEQTQPIRRKVAIKLIKEGMDSRAVLARFEAERQALALMDHPHIAKILDAGVTEQGRPYFVMEYVKGVPLTEYCDEARLTVAERLQLFLSVCKAIQHAHQKGIIHRDLKPSNILVCLYDGQPVPKVIDFGLAKAMHQSLTDQTLYTAHGVMLGTPLYMSPEQAELNNLDIDTRADVYSLGVILYELLTGSTPLEKQRIQQAAWLEMLRLIKEEEPPSPSTRLSASQTLPTVAAQRRLEPVKLSRLLTGELDWIVMRALEKNRGRRYESPGRFAEDIERYLRNDLVEAKPPSTLYRLGKTYQRHRAAILTSSAFVLLLIVTTAVSISLALAARRAEQTALNREDEAKQARQSETIAREKAELQAFQLRYNELKDGQEIGTLQGLVRLLKSVPAHARGWEDFLKIKLINNASEFALPTTLSLHDGTEIARYAWNSDQRLLLALTNEAKLQLLEYPSLRCRVTFEEYPVPSNRNHDNWGFVPGDRMFWSISTRDGQLRFWDTSSGKPVGNPIVQETAIRDAYFNADGTRMVTRSEQSADDQALKDVAQSNRLQLWDIQSGTRIAILDVTSGMISSLLFVPGKSEFVASVHERKSLCVWSSMTGEKLQEIRGFDPFSPQFAISDSGRVLAASTPRQVVWFETRTWTRDAIATQLPSNDGQRSFELEFVPGSDEYLRGGTSDMFSPALDYLFAAKRESANALLLIPDRLSGSYMLAKNGEVYDITSLQKLQPPSGRRYADEARNFAVDRRWLAIGNNLIDLNTEQTVSQSHYQHVGTQGIGWVNSYLFLAPGQRGSFHSNSFGGMVIWPLPDHADSISSDQLIAWLELLTCQALDGDTGPRHLSEDDWESRRRDFVRRWQPGPGYQLPGFNPTDRLFWLRAEQARTPTYLERQSALLTRLIEEDPTWHHYLMRANWRGERGDLVGAIQDEIEAGRLAGRVAWNMIAPEGSLGVGRVGENDGNFAHDLAYQPNHSPADYHTLLTWIDRRTAAGIHDRFLDVLRGFTLYRLERFSDAVNALDSLQLTARADWARDSNADAVLIRAMARQRLGQSDVATSEFEAAKAIMTDVSDTFFGSLLNEAEPLFRP